MNDKENITARQLALAVLNEFSIDRHDAGTLLHKMLPRTTEKAFATELTYSSIRNTQTLDMIISDAADLPKSRIQNELLNILRIGAYELIFTPSTPEYAVVNEAVKLTGQIAGKKQAAFTNAVLRNIVRAIANRAAPLEEANLRMTIPYSASHGCRFSTAILPHPKQSPAEYFSKAFSMPKWLAERWLNNFGFEKTKEICLASNRRPGVYIQPNILKISPEQLAEKFTIAGITNRIVKGPKIRPMIKIQSPQQIMKLPGFREGLFTIQDPAAAKVPYALKPLPGQTIIDICSAPGTKTALLAWLMENTGNIIATDIDPQRLKMVDQTCQRLNISIVKTVPYDQLPDVLRKTPQCHAVLLDVPCSNTAVLARRPEARFRLKPEMIPNLMETQTQLLKNTVKIIEKYENAKICYSTCSILKEENTRLVQKFVDENPHFELLSELLTLPTTESQTTFDHDGGFLAIIQKKSK